MSEEVKTKTTGKPTPEYTIVKPKFELYLFSSTLSDKKILFQVLKMVNSVFIVVNYTASRQLNDLSLAMINEHGRQPLSAQLMGDFSDISSNHIASKLTKKLKKVVYLSCNVAMDKNTLNHVLERLIQEINLNPKHF